MAERQTHTTQNRAGNHVGSNPTFGTKQNKSEFISDFFVFVVEGGVAMQLQCNTLRFERDVRYRSLI